MRILLLGMLLGVPIAGFCDSLEGAKDESGALFGDKRGVGAAPIELAALAAGGKQALLASLPASARLAIFRRRVPVVIAPRVSVPPPSLPTRRRDWPKEENRLKKLGAALGAVAAGLAAASMIGAVPSFDLWTRIFVWSGLAGGFAAAVSGTKHGYGYWHALASGAVGAACLVIINHFRLDIPPAYLLFSAANAAWINFLLLKGISVQGTGLAVKPGLGFLVFGPMLGLMFGVFSLPAAGAVASKKLGAALGRWLDSR